MLKDTPKIIYFVLLVNRCLKDWHLECRIRSFLWYCLAVSCIRLGVNTVRANLLWSLVTCIYAIRYFCKLIYWFFCKWKDRSLSLFKLCNFHTLLYSFFSFWNNRFLFFIRRVIWNILWNIIGIPLVRIMHFITLSLLELFFCKFTIVFIIIFYIKIYFSTLLVKRENWILFFTYIF